MVSFLRRWIRWVSKSQVMPTHLDRRAQKRRNLREIQAYVARREK
jgi:hypothetical protein